jgi:farnesyl diphosphate synthase
MSFERQLVDTATSVEALLDGLMSLDSALAPRVMEAMRYSVLGGGKRIRPFFVVECARLAGADPERALWTAAALECIHCYSLVHDDLPAMDDDDLRRGRPTTHKAFGEATAILAGDGLLTLGFEILTSVEAHPDAAVRIELIRELAGAAGANGMVGGQMLDMQAGNRSPGTDDIVAMQRLKTGKLIEFACRAGAILGGADGATRAALATYAANIGLAFQVADDLLDAEGAQMGKRTGKDEGSGKATFVGLLGLDGARAKARGLVDDAIAALAPFGERADMLREAARFILARRS